MFQCHMTGMPSANSTEGRFWHDSDEAENLALLVDSHVPLHDCYDVVAFLDGASANFQRAGEQLALAKPCIGCLMLADTANHGSFARLLDAAMRASISGWDLRQTAESCSLVGLRDGNPELGLLAGRQIATAEGV